jgi:glutamine synthetase
MFTQATYIWLDGAKPTKKLRSKTRILPHPTQKEMELEDFPEWGFDGSSTYQAEGRYSDLILKPVNFIRNPLLHDDNYLVLCEVFNPDNTPHPTNTRSKLCQLLDAGGNKADAWIGFEQEYTLFQGNVPLGWPENGYPAPQGPFYCGVGADEVFGRELVQDHTQACLDSGLHLFGINAEVMPGQWEFQIGYRGIEEESADPLTISDHLWFARWLLYRIGEEYNITATLDPKPVKGDWNGAGKHTNFSTAAMRNKDTGAKAIQDAIDVLSKKHDEHICVYGYGLAERLTGQHETAHIGKFSHGVSDRSASIRIPQTVAQNGYGYIEDRRPGANADPYEVSAILLQTICHAELNVKNKV